MTFPVFYAIIITESRGARNNGKNFQGFNEITLDKFKKVCYNYYSKKEKEYIKMFVLECIVAGICCAGFLGFLIGGIFLMGV